jgi:hypothetical protein
MNLAPSKINKNFRAFSVLDGPSAARRTVTPHNESSKAARSLVAPAVRPDRLCPPNGEVH